MVGGERSWHGEWSWNVAGSRSGMKPERGLPSFPPYRQPTSEYRRISGRSSLNGFMIWWILRVCGPPARSLSSTVDAGAPPVTISTDSFPPPLLDGSLLLLLLPPPGLPWSRFCLDSVEPPGTGGRARSDCASVGPSVECTLDPLIVTAHPDSSRPPWWGWLGSGAPATPSLPSPRSSPSASLPPPLPFPDFLATANPSP